MRIDKIIEILNTRDDINGWKLKETKQDTYELYYIRRDLEMNRAKNIHNIELTVYKDFHDNDKYYKGSSVTKIYPTMTKDEIIKAIDDASYASQFAKVKYYPLVHPVNETLETIGSNLKNKTMDEYMSLIVDAIFKADSYEKGSINSTEIFFSRISTRLVNSLGIDYSHDKYLGTVEFITNWKEDKEEIELFQHIDFGDFNSEKLTKDVQEMLEMSKARAISKPTPNLEGHGVILTGDSVKELLKFYYYQSNVNYVYEKYSTAKLGESIQGDNIVGDKITITLMPSLKGSTKSASFDNDGIVLKEATIIEDGILKSYWGNQRYSHYLEIKPSGVINNYLVNKGKYSVTELKNKPYLEVISFSSFQLDDITGDFGGEIRLGWYFDGDKVIPVSGGSISGSLREKQNEMFLSKETVESNDYIGPKHILMNNLTVSGT